MKNILLLTFLFPIVLVANNRPDYAVFLIDSSMTKGANAVIRSYHSVFDVKSPGEATHRVKMVVTRLNKNARYDDVGVYYDSNSKVTYLKATIYDAFGNEVRKIKKNEIIDHSAVSGGTMYADDRVKYIDLSYGEYPYTIEYEYETQMKSIMLYPIWMVQNLRTSVERSSYNLSLPPSISVSAQLLNLEKAELKETREASSKSMTWQVANLNAIGYESGTPEPYKQIAMGHFVPNKFIAEGNEGDMSSWEAYGKFMYKLNEDRDVLSSNMQAKVADLVANLDSEEEKIAALYRYLQENMRYVSVQLGIGGWQTFDAQYVEENKFGDCKALSNFMKAMLKEVNIPSYTTLVYAGDNVPLQVTEEFSYPKFNHMILYVPSSETWLECTSNLAPPNYLGTFTADRSVLLITKEGGKLARTPKMDASINWKRTKTHIQIEAKGAATINRQLHSSGIFQDLYREAKEHASKEELEEYLLQSSDLPMSDIENLAVLVEKDKPEAQVSYDLKVARYASKGGKRLFIPINSIGAFDDLPPKAKTKRKHPYAVKYGYIQQDTILLQLPAQAKVESTPKNVNLSSDYGSLKMDYQMDGQQLKCVRTLEVNALEVPAEEYETYRDFFKQVTKKDKAKLVVVINQV
ncbi:MAG: DUF3857 domain-containing transglutaminase family protein [Bacteroidota bacterium]